MNNGNGECIGLIASHSCWAEFGNLRQEEPDMGNMMLGHLRDDNHKAEELQDVAQGARHDCHRVRYAHLLVRPGTQVLKVAARTDVYINMGSRLREPMTTVGKSRNPGLYLLISLYVGIMVGFCQKKFSAMYQTMRMSDRPVVE